MVELDYNFIRQGGVMVYPLLLVSLVGFALFFERLLFLHKGHIDTSDFVAGIKNLIRKQRLIEALTLCEDTPGPLARIVKAALLNYGQPPKAIRHAIQSAAIVEVPVLERRVGTIGILARIAPTLGFLGTLIAILQALYFLEGAIADSGAFSQLLAEALITSAIGLAIGIMAAIGHHFLSGRVRALVHDFEWMSHEIFQFLTTDETAPKASDSDA